MRRDGDNFGIDPAAGCACRCGYTAVGQQRYPCYGLLPVKDLHAVQHHSLPAVQRGFDTVKRIGTHGGIVFIQTVGRVGCIQIGGFGIAVCVGREMDEGGSVFVQHGQAGPGQRSSLAGSGCVDQNTAFGHR